MVKLKFSIGDIIKTKNVIGFEKSELEIIMIDEESEFCYYAKDVDDGIKIWLKEEDIIH